MNTCFLFNSIITAANLRGLSIGFGGSALMMPAGRLQMSAAARHGCAEGSKSLTPAAPPWSERWMSAPPPGGWRLTRLALTRAPWLGVGAAPLQVAVGSAVATSAELRRAWTLLFAGWVLLPALAWQPCEGWGPRLCL